MAELPWVGVGPVHELLRSMTGPEQSNDGTEFIDAQAGIAVAMSELRCSQGLHRDSARELREEESDESIGIRICDLLDNSSEVTADNNIVLE